MAYPTPQLVQQFQESSAVIAGSGVFTGPARDAGNNTLAGAGNTRFRVFASADQAGTYVVQQSRDGVTWYTVGAATTVAAATPSITDFLVALRYVRIVYTNGALGQGAFELDSALLGV